MNDPFSNVYEDEERARAYATLEFPGTYYLAFRDLPGLIRRHNHGSRALDFGPAEPVDRLDSSEISGCMLSAQISPKQCWITRVASTPRESTASFVTAMQ